MARFGKKCEISGIVLNKDQLLKQNRAACLLWGGRAVIMPLTQPHPLKYSEIQPMLPFWYFSVGKDLIPIESYAESLEDFHFEVRKYMKAGISSFIPG